MLFTNLRLFDGVTARLHGGRSVLVEGGRITAVLSGADRPIEGVQIIDCGGRTLMPGLIDAHWHSMLCAMSMMELMTADLGLITLAATKNQGAILAQMTRWYSSGEVLLMATGRNAELLALSGERNPYPGKLGVIEAGAYADLLIVDGDPLTNIALVADPEANLRLIMKGGRIYKNALQSG
ncbi:imidazolonepropionase-like amidohydrolase [Brevundimonas bullata]|uniref:Imidazolonepropionase-like amidohydrolase n=1 Tax=Brevundimonas bullata TaxID=13160 RepID=A0A7W7IMR4_9CAUL|nr:hypothetical protein [Brevundimonas bullata]MBB4797199.1 imidazolonepropionase-like amidohydrolase [Brevundimonas bullata]MBB6382158.1 imidazolonepropionase-like amidohydrolase [Brevundimonas bullata]